MVSIAEMKSQLVALEEQKSELQEEIQTADQRFKLSLLGVGIGILLLPLYGSGIPVLLVAGIVAIYYSIKKSSFEDKLETIESEIHKLEISMA